MFEQLMKESEENHEEIGKHLHRAQAYLEKHSLIVELFTQTFSSTVLLPHSYDYEEGTGLVPRFKMVKYTNKAGHMVDFEGLATRRLGIWNDLIRDTDLSGLVEMISLDHDGLGQVTGCAYGDYDLDRSLLLKLIKIGGCDGLSG